MQEPNPSLLVAPALGAICGALAAWARDEFVAWRRRARLSIDGPVYYQESDWRVWQIVVRNHGRATARACIALVTIQPTAGARVTAPGLLTQQSLDDGGSAGLGSIPVAWLRKDHPVEIAIHPRQAQRFDLCRVRIGKPFAAADVTIPTEEGYAHPRVVFSGAGFEFSAQVGSDNADPVDCFGRAHWDERGLRVELADNPKEELQHFTVLPRRTWWQHLLGRSAVSWKRFARRD